MFHSSRLAARAAALLILPASLAAQTVTATLVGTVRDGSAAAIPNAAIQVTETATNLVTSSVTNDSGDYVLAQLRPGVYQVAAEAMGFKRTVVQEVALLVNQTARLDLTLKVGEVTEAVEVTANAAVVASETSSIAQAIDTHQMANLPLKGRGFFELALLAPAVSPQQPGSFVGNRRPMPGGLNAPAFNVAGAKEKSTGYLIDGVDSQDPHYLTPSFFPSVDAIQEFRLETNAYSAEFGRSAAQVNAATRSGGNDVHGAVYHYFRNNSLDATNFFDNFAGRPQSPLRYNQFGAAVGGPLSLPKLYSGRNRTFYFVNYEGTRIRRGRTGQLNVPAPEQRAGDFSRTGFRNNQPVFDPATTRTNPSGAGNIRDPFPGSRIPAARFTQFSRTVLDLYPLPNFDMPTGNNYFAALSDNSDNNQGIARIDHRFNEHNSIFFRYAAFDGAESAKSPIDGGGSSTDVRTQNLAFNYVRTFTPTTLNELRLGYNRPIYLILQDGSNDIDYASKLGIKNLLTDPIGWGVPNVTPAGFSGIGNSLNPTTQVSNVYHLVDHVNLIRGGHTLKFGADLRKTNYNDRSERNVRGSFNFSGLMTANPGVARTGVSIADLLLGLPVNATGSNTSLAANMNGFTYAFFLQDDWKVSRRLTLNLGLRYELNSRFTDVQNRLTLFDTSFPGGRLRISGTSQAYIPGRGIVDGPATPRGLLPADKNNFAPRLGIAFRPFGDNSTAIRAGYGVFYDIVELQDLRTFVRNPPFGEVIDLRGDQNSNSSSPAVLRVTELFPDRGSPAARPSGFSPLGSYLDPYYQQWNFSVQRALPSSILLEAGYIGTKGTRLAQRLNVNQAFFDADPARPTPILSRRPFPLFGDTIRLTENDANSTYHGGFVKLERRFSAGFSFLGSYTWSKTLDAGSLIDDMPRDIRNKRLSKGRASFDIRHRAVLSGSWELPFGKGRRYLANGGARDWALGGWQLNTIASMRSGFPFTVTSVGDVCNCAANLQTAQQVGDPRSGFTRDRTLWFNTNAFTRPATGTLGSAGRNILDGPGRVVFDISLFKAFRLNERVSLQLRAEAFNAFNQTGFGQPGSQITTPNYGVIQGASDPRIFQLALRLRF